MLGACVSPQMNFKTSQHGEKVLDVEFSRIVMRGPMIAELDRLFQTVCSNTRHKNVCFVLELDREISREGWGADRTFDELDKYNNTLVNIDLKDVTFSQVLFDMTTQAKWDYYVAPHAIIFVVGKNVSRKAHYNSAWAGNPMFIPQNQGQANTPKKP